MGDSKLGLSAALRAAVIAVAAIGCSSEQADSRPSEVGSGAGGDAGVGGDAGAAGSGASGGTGGQIIGTGGSSGGSPDEPATCAQAAEARTYVGCEFWPTVTYNPVYPSFDFAAVVANGGDVAAEITVERAGSAVGSDTVEPGSLRAIVLPWVDGLKGPHFDAQTTGARVHESVRVDGGAYRLTSSVPVTVWQFNPLQYERELAQCTVAPAYGDATRCLSVANDAALLLPATAMTGSYRLFGRSAKNGGEVWGSTPGAFAITATQDGTHIEVQLTGAVAAGPGVTAAATGTSVAYDLNAGDVVQLLGVWGAFWDDAHADLSGSLAISDKPFQVVASNPLSSVPDETTGFADHLEETVLPAEALGKRYLVSPPTAPDAKVVGHVVRFYGNVDATTLSYPAGAPPGAPATLSAGQVVEIGPLATAFEVTADQAFAVGSFMIGGQKQDPSGSDVQTRGDPAFSMMVTPEQFRRRYTFLAPPDYLENYADIVLPDGTNVTLDGSPASGAPEPIGSSGWSVWRVRLGPGNAGAHRLEADQPVGLQVMGFGHATAYYYPGGLDVKLIAPPPIPR
jgi:hypothetical protein